MSLTQKTIEFILFDKLRYYHKAGLVVDHEIKFEDALEDEAVIGISPRDIFKNSCRYAIYINGGGKTEWPQDWLSMNCTLLAVAIVKQQEDAANVAAAVLIKTKKPAQEPKKNPT